MSTLERTTTTVLKSFPKITSAWIFGSHARGQTRPDSDLDIAILVTDPLSTNELVQLSSKLSWETRQDRVDLVVLNEALPILAFEAISGLNVLCLDAAIQAEFSSLTCRLYEEDMAMWKRGLAYRREAS
jgi:predicted nucleotidyltransferase